MCIIVRVVKHIRFILRQLKLVVIIYLNNNNNNNNKRDSHYCHKIINNAKPISTRFSMLKYQKAYNATIIYNTS